MNLSTKSYKITKLHSKCNIGKNDLSFLLLINYKLES